MAATLVLMPIVEADFHPCQYGFRPKRNAEVFKKKGDGTPRLTDEENGKLLKYLESDYLVFVEVDRAIAEEANRLCRRYRDAKLAPCDAIHIASALRAKCDALLTWDQRLVRVKHPDLRIEQPRIVGQVEMEFETPET
jgi:predicted nucleic acid-binding protein